VIYSILLILFFFKSNDTFFFFSFDFIVSGVSDNLDPIVSQTARRKQSENDAAAIAATSASNQVEQNQRVSTKLNRSASQSHKNLNKRSIFFSSSSSQSTTTASTSSDKKIQQQITSNDDQTINISSLPQLTPYERYMCGLAHMNEILLRNRTLNDTLSAQETCAILIEHVLRLTCNKRELLEKGLLEASKLSSSEEKLKFQASLREKVQKLRGKLDHASIVAYEVGFV
jgi:hypothetical protein